MNWKDPAVAAQLERLWNEGHSCSAIARMIGAVSRNSVIGAVRRQNLPFRGYRPGGVVAKHIANPSKSRSQVMGGKIAKKKAGKPFVFSKKAPSVSPMQALFQADGYVPPAEEIVIPENERKSIQTLEENDCRWPIGDPRKPDFHFCGKPKIVGLPYCEVHARRAYQPPRPRPPATPMSIPVFEREREAA
jgi:GcrA cell cycle regulator